MTMSHLPSFGFPADWWASFHSVHQLPVVLNNGRLETQRWRSRVSSTPCSLWLRLCGSVQHYTWDQKHFMLNKGFPEDRSQAHSPVTHPSVQSLGVCPMGGFKRLFPCLMPACYAVLWNLKIITQGAQLSICLLQSGLDVICRFSVYDCAVIAGDWRHKTTAAWILLCLKLCYCADASFWRRSYGVLDMLKWSFSDGVYLALRTPKIFHSGLLFMYLLEPEFPLQQGIIKISIYLSVYHPICNVEACFIHQTGSIIIKTHSSCFQPQNCMCLLKGKGSSKAWDQSL